MSLRPDPIGPVPDETARVAQAAFPRGTAWMRLRDVLGPIYEDATFAPLFSQRGRPAEAPWRLALVSVMQFAERLSDRKPRMPCVEESTGSTRSACHSVKETGRLSVGSCAVSTQGPCPR